MLRTVSLKLETTPLQAEKFAELQATYADVCNLMVPAVQEHHCWNRVALHHFVYYPVREQSPLGSQMVCNAIFSVCSAYRALRLKYSDEIPTIEFKHKSIHFDKRTYRLLSENVLSLYTMQGREAVPYHTGEFQEAYLKEGTPKEGELLRKNGTWYFNLVLEFPDPPEQPPDKALGVDLGENNLVTTSSGMIISGKQLCYERDKYLALRRRVQSNGSKSAKQLLKKLSGKEQRHVKYVNHVLSKRIVTEALRTGATRIILESLTNIRKRIRARKRIRTRLHRWAWRQLQAFIEYKARTVGIVVEYINPAYTSQTCSICGALGSRQRHKFSCSCGNVAHADLNASLNIATLALSIGIATGIVTCRHVGGLQPAL